MRRAFWKQYIFFPIGAYDGDLLISDVTDLSSFCSNYIIEFKFSSFFQIWLKVKIFFLKYIYKQNI